MRRHRYQLTRRALFSKVNDSASLIRSYALYHHYRHDPAQRFRNPLPLPPRAARSQLHNRRVRSRTLAAAALARVGVLSRPPPCARPSTTACGLIAAFVMDRATHGLPPIPPERARGRGIELRQGSTGGRAVGRGASTLAQVRETARAASQREQISTCMHRRRQLGLQTRAPRMGRVSARHWLPAHARLYPASSGREAD